MLGAIIGDILGQPYESWLFKAESKDMDLLLPQCKFTDDTVLTIAIADALMHGRPYEVAIKEWALKYPNSGYGSMFRTWMASKTMIVNDSYSNGCAMRVSPIAYAFDDLVTIKNEILKSIAFTHNTDEAYWGAFAIAACVFMARKGFTKNQMKQYITETVPYPEYKDMNVSVSKLKTWNKRDIRCNITVPQALNCFFRSTSYEDCVRNALYSEGDCDTIAAMSGAIAEAYYKKIPQYLKNFVAGRIPFEMSKILRNFKDKYPSVLYL